MEQRHNDSSDRINPAQISPFVKIAANAGERQIVCAVIAAVLLWHDVLNMKTRKGNVVLMQAAVFAAIIGSLPHELTSRRVH